VCDREREEKRCRIQYRKGDVEYRERDLEYRKIDVEYNRKSYEEYMCVCERERKSDGEYNTEKEM